MGITWGGSLYSAIDPIYGVMLYKLLKYRYRVVDKSATIEFKKPAKKVLYAHFCITLNELKEIKKLLETEGRADRHYTVDLYDEDNIVHATCQKIVSIRKKKTHKIGAN